MQKLEHHEKSFELYVIPNLGYTIYVMEGAVVDIILQALPFIKGLYV